MHSQYLQPAVIVPTYYFCIYANLGTSIDEGVGICFSLCEHLLHLKVTDSSHSTTLVVCFIGLEK